MSTSKKVNIFVQLNFLTDCNIDFISEKLNEIQIQKSGYIKRSTKQNSAKLLIAN